VEIIYQNIANMPHPDFGVLKLVYFGHQSEGQEKITRATAEAIVMLLEENGYYLCNGLSEAATLLRENGYLVASADERTELPDGIGLGDPAGTPVGPPDPSGLFSSPEGGFGV
jgi:hypothetical protein